MGIFSIVVLLICIWDLCKGHNGMNCDLCDSSGVGPDIYQPEDKLKTSLFSLFHYLFCCNVTHIFSNRLTCELGKSVCTKGICSNTDTKNSNTLKVRGVIHSVWSICSRLLCCPSRGIKTLEAVCVYIFVDCFCVKLIIAHFKNNSSSTMNLECIIFLFTVTHCPFIMILYLYICWYR